MIPALLITNACLGVIVSTLLLLTLWTKGGQVQASKERLKLIEAVDRNTAAVEALGQEPDQEP